MHTFVNFERTSEHAQNEKMWQSLLRICATDIIVNWEKNVSHSGGAIPCGTAIAAAAALPVSQPMAACGKRRRCAGVLMARKGKLFK